MKLGIAKKLPACRVSQTVFPNSKLFVSLQLYGCGCHITSLDPSLIQCTEQIMLID